MHYFFTPEGLSIKVGSGVDALKLNKTYHLQKTLDGWRVVTKWSSGYQIGCPNLRQVLNAGNL